MHTSRLFFIVGSGRSGTTLLQSMFLAAPGIYIPPETHFLPIARRIRTRFGPPERPRGRRRLVAAILANCAENEIPVDADRLEAELLACAATEAAMFDALLRHIQSRRPECRRLGEKSPVHLPYAPDLLRMFPDARVITIVRDGRDVALSQTGAFGRSMLQAALGWRRDQRLHARFRDELPPDRYTGVRYEDLVQDPEPELRRLCAFLEEPFDDRMLAPHERPTHGFATWEQHKALTRKPVTTARIGRYRTELDPAEIALFQWVARRELEANGYPIDPVPARRGLLLGLRQVPGLIVTRLRRRRLMQAGA